MFQKIQNGHVKGKDGSISKGVSQVGHMLKYTEGSWYPQLFKQKWKIEDCDFVPFCEEKTKLEISSEIELPLSTIVIYVGI